MKQSIHYLQYIADNETKVTLFTKHCKECNQAYTIYSTLQTIEKGIHYLQEIAKNEMKHTLFKHIANNQIKNTLITVHYKQ